MEELPVLCHSSDKVYFLSPGQLPAAMTGTVEHCESIRLPRFSPSVVVYMQSSGCILEHIERSEHHWLAAIIMTVAFELQPIWDAHNDGARL